MFVAILSYSELKRKAYSEATHTHRSEEHKQPGIQSVQASTVGCNNTTKKIYHKRLIKCYSKPIEKPYF